jgi:hypothetical protein
VNRHLIINATQGRDFAGEGRVAQDNDAFFLSNNAEIAELTGLIQSAARQPLTT